MSTNIVVNTRVMHKPNTGIKRYAAELLRRFGGKVRSISPDTNLQDAKGHLWEQFVLPNKLDGGLLWSPTGSGPLIVKNQVVTIHDISFLDHPEWFSQKFAAWYSWMIPRLVRRVSKVIAVSEFTKQSLIRRIGIAEDKVTAIPEGVDLQEFYPRSIEEVAAIRTALQLPSSNYILSFGTLEPRKNLGRLIEAWGRIQDQIASRDVWLVVAGAKGKSGVFQEVDLSDLPPRVFLTGYVADEHLPALYSGAMALAYVSLYEGFGLPPLEAMATGTPSLTGNLTSIPEVIGDAGLMVDPYDVDAIASGLLQMVRDDGMRNTMHERGRDRARLFSWDTCARKTLAVLESAGNRR